MLNTLFCHKYEYILNNFRFPVYSFVDLQSTVDDVKIQRNPTSFETALESELFGQLKGIVQRVN